MTVEQRRYRRLRWPVERRGLHLPDAAVMLGIRTRELLELVEDGVIAIWIDEVERGNRVDAEEVEALARARGLDPDDPPAGPDWYRPRPA